MPKFVYASPLIAEKSSVVRYVYRQKRENPQMVGDETSFRLALGLEGWQAWLQKTPQGDFFVHYLETDQLDKVFTRIHTLIQQEYPKALWLRDFYLEVLGRDYSDPSAAPTLLQLADMEAAGPFPDRGEIVSQGYLLPLLPKKIDAYREFCRQIMGEHRGRYQESLYHLHITKTSLYLQRSLAHDHIIVYREKILLPQEYARRPHEVRAANPSYQWVSNQLMNLTGLAFDQLEPNLEYLTPQPLATIHQRTGHPALALTQ